MTGDHEPLASALAAIKAWMRDHGAAANVENLAPGASSAHLDAIEARLGFALPPDLRALWATHDGQRREGNGFVETWDLLSSEQAVTEVMRRRALRPVRSLREHPMTSSVTDAELRSDAWLALASRDQDGLVVQCETARVFVMVRGEDPPLALVADSVRTWAEQYAAQVVSDAYGVERGAGGVFLSLDGGGGDEGEEDEDEDEDEETEAARRLATPAAELVAWAIARRDPHDVMDFLKLARDRAPALFDEAVERLFDGEATPGFVVRALQPFLATLTLSAERWRVVAAGAEANENAAVRDLARRTLSE